MSNTLKPAPAIRPALAPVRVRCPVSTTSHAFDGNVCRCVLPDTHGGPCKTIDGSDLTAEAYSPRMRYQLMSLEPPAHLPDEGPAS